MFVKLVACFVLVATLISQTTARSWHNYDYEESNESFEEFDGGHGDRYNSEEAPLGWHDKGPSGWPQNNDGSHWDDNEEGPSNWHRSEDGPSDWDNRNQGPQNSRVNYNDLIVFPDSNGRITRPENLITPPPSGTPTTQRQSTTTTRRPSSTTTTRRPSSTTTTRRPSSTTTTRRPSSTTQRSTTTTRRSSTTTRATVARTTVNGGTTVNELLILLCIRSCPVTSEYNPVCGSNNVTYSNPGRLECARTCGLNVAMQRRAPCPTATSTTTTTRRPSSTTTRRPSSTTVPAINPTRFTAVNANTQGPATSPGQNLISIPKDILELVFGTTVHANQ